MQSAQQVPKHSAQLGVMQGAYASAVKISSTRHINRMHRLEELVTEAGSATALATKIAVPKSHISALQAGNRGIGDLLAAKLERKFDKPAGWMDLPAGANLTMSELNGFEGQLVTLFRQLGPDTQHDTLVELNDKVGARSTKPSAATPYANEKSASPPRGAGEPPHSANVKTLQPTGGDRGGYRMTAEQKRRYAAAKKRGT